MIMALESCNLQVNFQETVAQRYVETPGMNVLEPKDEGGFEERMHYIDINPFYFRGNRGNFFEDGREPI